MTYPGNFLRLVCGGRLYGVEDWTFSLSIVPNFEDSPAQPDEVPPGVISAVQTFFTSPGMISSRATLTHIKLNLIGPDGRYVSKTDTVRHDFVTPVAGAFTTGSPPPPQIACAVTLRTPNKRGLASSGRFYLPLPPPPGTDGLLSTGDAASIATNARTFISALNTAIPTGDVGVASNVGSGKFNPVTYVEVGRVLDTIRSRRANFAEAYSRSSDVDLASG